MTFTHLKPGNVIKWNSQHWIAVEVKTRLLLLTGFNNSREARTLTSKTEPPPVLVAENAADHVIDLVNHNY